MPRQSTLWPGVSQISASKNIQPPREDKYLARQPQRIPICLPKSINVFRVQSFSSILVDHKSRTRISSSWRSSWVSKVLKGRNLSHQVRRYPWRPVPIEEQLLYSVRVAGERLTVVLQLPRYHRRWQAFVISYRAQTGYHRTTG